MISFFGQSFGGAAFDVGAGALVVAHADQHDGVQGVVGCAVAAAVEAVAVGAPGGGRDRGGPGEVGERGFGVHALGVVAGGGQQLPGGLGTDAEQVQQPRRGLADQRCDQGVEFADLLLQPLVAAG